MKVKCIAPEWVSEQEKWPEALPVVPEVGQRVTSAKEWGESKQRLTLVITRVDWEPVDDKEWMPVLVLGVPLGNYVSAWEMQTNYERMKGE